MDSAGDIYIADSGNNRIQEIAKATGNQWGQSMTAGDIYTVAGSPGGTARCSPNGTQTPATLLRDPQSMERALLATEPLDE